MSLSSSSSDEDEVEVKKVSKKQEKKADKKGKKRAAEKDETPEPEAKKEKSEKKTATSTRPKDDQGNEMFEFGNMRFASVSTFKGKEYLNIREYYTDKNGKMAPGKKGISLNKAQWNNLKDIIPELDKKFA